jgi:hypothetical protein
VDCYWERAKVFGGHSRFFYFSLTSWSFVLASYYTAQPNATLHPSVMFCQSLLSCLDWKWALTNLSIRVGKARVSTISSNWHHRGDLKDYSQLVLTSS